MIMKYKVFIVSSFILIAITVAAAVGCTRSTASQTTPDSGNAPVAAATPKTETASSKTAASDDEFNGDVIVKTAEEWKKQLTPAAFYVLREEGTERPYSGENATTHEDGDYYCAACHLKLFSSKTKFESGTGWPSFYEPINKKNVKEVTDTSLGETRTEVECARCHGHLGHVFDDGPKPTGLRYCMNSVSLKFEKAVK